MANFKDKNDTNVFLSNLAAEKYRQEVQARVDNSIIKVQNLKQELINRYKELESGTDTLTDKQQSKIDYLVNKIVKMEKIQAHEVMKAGIDLQENASKKLYTESSTTYVSNVKKRVRKPKDKLLENVLDKFNKSGFFQLESNKAINALSDINNNYYIPYTDYKGLNMTASTEEMTNIYNKVNSMIKNQKGFIHSIDTETLGATTQSNVWRPSFVTEFAKITTDLSTNTKTKTNILLSDQEVYEKEFNRVMEALNSGAAGQRMIKEDPSLRVSMERFALYGHNKTKISFNEALGYSQVDSIADISDIPNIYNKKLIEEGYRKLKTAKALDQTVNLNNKSIKIKSDLKGYVDAVAEIQRSIATGEAIVNGYNINNFDFKTINSSLQKMLSKDKDALEYAYYKFGVNNISEIGLRQMSGSVLDMQNLARAYTNKYGNKSLIGEAIYNQIHGQRVNRQEYLGQKFYPQMMNAAAHSAIADTDVVHSFVLNMAEGLEGKTLFQHLYEGVMDANYTQDFITSADILIANKGTAFNSDRNVLDFVTDMQNNVYFNSGFSIIDGKLRHDNINVAPTVGIKKNALYQIDNVFVANSKDFYENIGMELPEYSSGQLYILKAKRFHGDKYNKGFMDEGFVYKVFNSEEEMTGFVSSTFSTAGYFDANSNFVINEDMEDVLKIGWKTNKGVHKVDKNWKNLNGLDKIKNYADYLDRRTLDEKSANFLFGDNAGKKIAGALDFIEQMRYTGYEDLLEKPESLIRFYNYKGTKTGKRSKKNGEKLTKTDFKKIEQLMKNNLGFFSLSEKQQKILPTTAINALYSLGHVQKMEDYYKKVLDAIALEKSGGKIGKHSKESYTELYKRLTKEGVQVDRIFNAVTNELMGQVVLERTNGNMEKAIEAVSHVSKSSQSVETLKNIYDFKISDKFYLNKRNKKTNKFDVYNNIEDFITVDIGKTNPTSTLINNITKKFLGDTEIKNEEIMYRYQRAAFQNFVKEIDKDRSAYKALFKNEDFSSMISEVLDNDNFDLEDSAERLIKAISKVKKDGKNLNIGISKPRYNRTTHVANKNAKAMNNLSTEAITNALKVINVVSLNKNNKANLVSDIVESRLFSKDRITNNTFMTEEDQARAFRLYEDVKKRMTATVEDLIEAAQQSGTDITFNRTTGDVILNRNGESKLITELANLKMDEGSNYLYLNTYAGTNIELHEAVYVDEATGKIRLGTNLGKEFGEKDRIQKDVARAIKNGNENNILDIINQRMIRNASEYKESALLNFSMKDFITGNGKIDLAQADKIFSYMFGEDATTEGKAIWDKLVSSGKLNSTNIARYAENLKELQAKDLSPILRTMAVTDIATIMAEFVDMNDPNAPALLDVLKTVAVTGKDTDAAKGIYSTGSRNVGNTMNLLDNQGRPTIISQLNARYLRSNTVEGTKHIYENFLIGSSVIEDLDVMGNIYRSINVGLEKAIGIQTDFVHSAAHLGVLGLRDTFSDEMERVINNFKFSDKLTIDDNFNMQDFYAKIANRYVGSTFEQSRIMDSRLVYSIYGNLPQDVQKLSTLKDLDNAIKTMASDIESGRATNKVKEAMDVLGSIKIDEGGNVSYSKSYGTIVHRGEGLFKTSSPYGDQISPFASKFENGILNFNIRTKENIELTEKEISELLTKKIKKELQGKSDEEAKKLIEQYKRPEGLFRLLLEGFDNGVKGTFEVQNVNASELIKMGNSDKGMAYLTLTKTGALDTNLKDILNDIGQGQLVGNSALTPQAIAAYINDYFNNEQDAYDLLNKYGVKSKEELIKKMVDIREIEQHEVSRMLFSEHGIFKGEVSAVINDNYIGHKNFGTTNSSTLSKATELLGKYYGKGDTKEEQYISAMDQIIDLINNNEDFQFLQMHIANGGQVAHSLRREGTTYVIDEGMKAEIDQFSSFNQDSFNKFIEHIDKKLEEAGASENDRLVYKDVYGYNKKGELEKYDKVIGNLRTRKIIKDGEEITMISGVNTNVVSKFYNDSEVQSYVSKDYLQAKTLLQEKKTALREAEEAGEKDLVKQLKDEINELNNRVFNEEPYSRGIKVDDQYRNILSAHKLDSVLEDDINKRFNGNNKVNQRYIDVAREFMIQDENGKLKFREELKTENVYDTLLENIKGLMTYDPTKEEKLTENMLLDPRYAKYANLYDFVTNDMKMELGVDSAERIYGIQGAYKSYSYNSNNTDKLEKELLNNYGFEAKTIREFASNYGKSHNQLDDLTGMGYIIDLGEDFNNLKIAVPGLGSHAGDQEIRKEWQSKFNALLKDWTEYDDYVGDPNAGSDYIENLRGRIINRVNDIKEASNNIVSKKGDLGSLAKIEVNMPYTRGKLLSLNDMSVGSFSPVEGITAIGNDIFNVNSFKSKAIINGKTLAEWEKGGIDNGGVFFDYGVASADMFEKLGFFRDDMIKSMGLKDRAEMENYLERYGTMELLDRYPNIISTSVQNVRMFLDKGAPDGTISIAEQTLLKFNGDSDGDSMSKMLIEHNGINYSHYEINRRRAQEYYSKRNIQATEEEIRDKTISNLTAIDLGNGKRLSKQQAIESYDVFRKYEADNTMNAIFNVDKVAELVLPTMYKDEAKNFKISGGVVGMYTDNLPTVGAQVEGGKSILGKIRVTNLQKAPGHLDEQGGTSFLIENTNKINSMINDIMANKDAIIKNTGIDLNEYTHLNDLFERAANGETANIHNFRYGQEQHAALDEILSIFEKDKASNNSVLKGTLEEAQDTIINRIRADIYNQNAISKSNKGVIGEVNAALYAVRQASRDTIGTLVGDNRADLTDKIIQKVGYEMEEHAISSKKKVFEPGDTRLKDLSDFISNAKLPRGNSLESVKSDVSSWIFDYMDTGKINEMYDIIERSSGAPSGHEKFIQERAKSYMNLSTGALNEEQAIAKAQADMLSDIYVTGINNINNDAEGRAAIQMYSTFGRRSGTIERAKKVNINDMSEKSLDATAWRLATQQKPTPKVEVPEAVVPIGESIKPESITRPSVGGAGAREIGREAISAVGDVVGGISSSGLAMGVIGLAAGLMISGYASGNPLKDPKNDHIENKPEEIKNEPLPTFFNDNGGYAQINPQQRGYVINIKADSKRGQRYTKKAMKQAVEASVGGSVNINMNFKSNNSGGFTDKDIEDIMQNYL